MSKCFKQRKRFYRKQEKSGKARRAYIAWQDSGDSSSNPTSKDDGEDNLCLIVGDVFDMSNVSSSSSENF